MRDRFRAANLDTPELDARLLAQLAFGLDSLKLVHRERDPAPPEGVLKLENLAARRLRGEPVVRIIGEKEFWGLDFTLNAETLVPRPETEMLVRKGAELLREQGPVRLLDLGTGTGAIAIALLSELPEAAALAVDLSSEAILAAQWNAERHGVARRFEARKGSWFEPVGPGDRFDLIVSNPPYIDRGAIQGLQPEVKDHDPRLALDGGWDGLDAYRVIAPHAGRYLKPHGTVLVEIGSTQGQAVSQLFSQAGYGRVEIQQDLAGLDRMVVASNLKAGG